MDLPTVSGTARQAQSLRAESTMNDIQPDFIRPRIEPGADRKPKPWSKDMQAMGSPSVAALHSLRRLSSA
jgi:hypothetical protein